MRYTRSDGVVYHDRCIDVTSGPDEPICNPCVEAGHPEQEGFDPAIPERPSVTDRSNT